MQRAAAFHSAMATMAESSSKKDLQWMDDESELLLHSTHLFKVKKEMKCEDWEAAKTKVSREPIRPRIVSKLMLRFLSKIGSRQRGEAF